MALTLKPQNPILKVYSEGNEKLHVDLTFHATVEKVDGFSPIPSKWTFSFKDEAEKIIGQDGEITESQRDTVVLDAGLSTLPIRAPRFTTPGRYILSVTAEYENSSMPADTQCSEMQVVPNDIDEEDSFIVYGTCGDCYLVALTFKTPEVSHKTDETECTQQVIQLANTKNGEPFIPDGFSSEDVGRPAPLARSVPKTVGAAFITCVMLNLQSKDNHKFALLSDQRKDAMADRLGSSSTKVQK